MAKVKENSPPLPGVKQSHAALQFEYDAHRFGFVLLLLIIAGVWSLQPAHISVSAPPSSGAFFSCIGITFLAYAGFGMMANAADKVKDPQVIMPRAFLVAIGVTTLLYISLALVLLSDVSALELEKYADTAVAQAASPLLGHVGYVIVVIGALLATASAINANLDYADDGGAKFRLTRQCCQRHLFDLLPGGVCGGDPPAS